MWALSSTKERAVPESRMESTEAVASASRPPAWLRRFLAGAYFAPCKSHPSSKNERNHFCVDCEEGPLCHVGWQAHLAGGHRTLQVRRASHMDAVRIADVARLLDVSSIQPYTINGAKIIFLLSRPQSKSTSKGTPRCCEVCGRSISDPVRFCSITCKLACVSAGYDDTSIALRCTGGGGPAAEDDDNADPPGGSQQEPATHHDAGAATAGVGQCCSCPSPPRAKRSLDLDGGERNMPPPDRNIRRRPSRLQIALEEEEAENTPRGHILSPNSVLLNPATPCRGGSPGTATAAATPTATVTATAMTKAFGHLLVFQGSSTSPATPRRGSRVEDDDCGSPSRLRHRKGVPHRSPLF